MSGLVKRCLSYSLVLNFFLGSFVTDDHLWYGMHNMALLIKNILRICLFIYLKFTLGA